MAGKFKTMSLVQEAELDRLRQRQIKDYNPGLNSLTKMQYQIFKIFNESEFSYEGKSKMLAQLQERFGFLLNKFQNACLTPAPVLPLPAIFDHGADGPPARRRGGPRQRRLFSPRESAEEEEGIASTERLSPAQSLKDLTTSSDASFLTI